MNIDYKLTKTHSSHFLSPLGSRSVEREWATIRSVLTELLESSVLRQFAQVWEDIGIEEENRASRRETMRAHLQVRNVNVSVH